MVKKILFLLCISLLLVNVFAQEKSTTLPKQGVSTTDLTKIKLYPNPITKGKVTVIFPEKAKVSNVEVFSVLGKKIYQRKNPHILDNRINIRRLKTGMYLLKISTENKSITKKIIVQ